MRVISGSAKGHKLIAPRGRRTRPTADRIKESLFNIIADKVEGAQVLDLFSGAGSLAIEALSRGANSAILVEADKGATVAIDRNLSATGLAQRAIVLQSSANRALDLAIVRRQAFDLIFLDPPYKIEVAELEAVLEKAAGWLSKQGQVVLEHRPDLRDLQPGGDLVLVDKRRYGDTALSFYKKREI